MQPLVPDLFFLDERERTMIEASLDFVRRHDAREAARLDDHLGRLGRAADLIRSSPPIVRSSEEPGRAPRTATTLLDLVCRIPSWDLDLNIPTKAVFGQAYLVAKINFFKAIAYALENAGASDDLKERARDEIAQSIYSKLAEELFLSIVTDQATARAVKASAARSLFRIWEERLETEIDDFAPLLEAIWEARNRLHPVLGTMRGTQEFFLLLREARDHRFLDYFSEGNVPEVEVQAFEEFLFGISHEEIERLREYLASEASGVLSPEQARGVLGRTKESWAPSGGPQDLYTSYKKRRVRATYRTLTGAPGPKKTAEEYVMIAFFLAEEAPADLALAAAT